MLMSQDSGCFFSVIMPLYNKRLYIGRAIESVVSQSFKDFEIVVVDDGSVDGSCSVIESLDYPRIKLFRQSNKGGAGGQARNTGMKEAKGEWFAFLDADDMWMPDHLSELKKVIERCSDAKIISSSTIEVPESYDLDMILQGESLISYEDYFSLASQKIGVINSSSTAIHNSVFQDLGGFVNRRSGPDLEYWARVALKYPLAISQRVTAIYFRGNGGNMEVLSKEKSPQPLPKALENISPSVATLSSRLDEIRSISSLYPSVVRYINSRISSAIRSAMINRDEPRIKALSKLYIKPCTHESRYWWCISSLPAPMLKLVSGGRGVAKHLYHQLKR